MLYLVTILLCMATIVMANTLFLAPIFNFDFIYVLLAVVISTISVIIIDGIFSTIVRRCFPKKWFNHDKKFFSASKNESNFYEKIGIKKWKEKILELGVFTSFRKNSIKEPRNNAYVERYILEANYGIVCHLFCMIFGFLIVLIYPIEYSFCFGVPVATVNLVLNLLPIMVLRYNLRKLHVLHRYNARLNEKTQT